MEIEEIEKQLTALTEMLAKMNKESGKKTTSKKAKPTGENSIKKPKQHTNKDIPTLINKMSKDELKTVFGTDIGKNKENPYKCGIKEFVKKFNIVSENAYPVYLKYENKHLIIKKLYGDKTKKICTDFLKEKLPTAKNSFVEKALQNELSRWE